MRNPQKSGVLWRRGAAAVEFAVIAPLFFLLIAGILEFGQAFRIQHALSTAARHGARAAIVDGSSNIDVAKKVRDRCAQSLGIPAADVQVVITINGTTSADLSVADKGDEITVTVNIPYSKAAVGFYAQTFANSTLSASCSLEHE